MSVTRQLDRVLVVDDDLCARMALAHTLLEAGFQVWQTGSGNVALAAVQTCTPDIVVLDVEMPVMDGFELYRRIRQLDEGREVPVIFISGTRVDEVSIVRALSNGASDFLRRPFGKQELLARIEVTLRNRFVQLELERLGTTDALTQLANRRAFFDLLEKERRRAHRAETPLAAIVLDIDRFKTINDTHGHPAGDRVLRAVGRALASGCRATDVVGRVGGEEFAVVCPCTDEGGAQGLAEKLRANVSAVEVDIGYRTFLRVTASFGIAAAFGPTLASPEDAHALLARADTALYDAKRAGRDRIELAKAV